MGQDNQVEVGLDAPVVDGALAMRCPGCAYDLRGLPRGERIECPECGGAFTAFEIAEAAKARLSRSVSAPLSVMAIIFGVPTLGVIVMSTVSLRDGSAAILAWVVVVLIGIALRRGERPRLGWSLALAVLPSALLFVAPNNRGEISLDFMVAVNAVPLVIWAVMWLLPPRPDPGAALLLLSLIPGVPGAALLFAGVRKYAIGEWWTCFSDPRTGYWYDQWPLYRGDAVALGAALVVPAAVVAAAGTFVRRGWLSGGTVGPVKTG